MHKYYPIHPRSLPQESFSSWLIRLMRGNIGQQPLHRFSRIEFGKNASVWNRDTDRSITQNIIFKLSRRTGRTAQSLRSQLLSGYEGAVFEKHNPYGNTKWILPIGVYHRMRKQYGQQWCPKCLSEDQTPYYRRHWRMAFASSCLQHGRLLADRCKNCEQPCIPHRGEFLNCHECGADLTKQKTTHAESIAMQTEYDFLQKAHNNNSVFYPRLDWHPILYFDIWHQVLGLLTFSKRSDSLRQNICRRFNGKDPFVRMVADSPSFEYLCVKDRHSIVGLAGRLMTGWPFRFVGLCAESDVWSSCVLKDMMPVRFELYNIAKTYLVGPLGKSS